ncbi:MAG: hypothetical protein LBU79_06955 [Planctomycetota bacterium]|jgi:hypothetical protein|nr:hypothetical protein [Planctomycetota bacterium]
MGLETDILADEWSPLSLLAANDAAGWRTLLDVMQQRRADFKTQLDRGVSQSEFKQGTALLESYDAALKGLELAWSRRHS